MIGPSMASDRKLKLGEKYGNIEGVEQPFAPEIQRAPSETKQAKAPYLGEENAPTGEGAGATARQPVSLSAHADVRTPTGGGFTGRVRAEVIGRIRPAFEAAYARLKPLFDALGVER